jgi:hypothetical protein
MDWNEFWAGLIANVFSAVTIVAVLGFLGKVLIDNYSSRTLEKYKSRLDKETETYKMHLSNLAEEFKVKFNKLHQERADIIKEFYIGLVNFQDNLRGYILYLKNPETSLALKNCGDNLQNNIKHITDIYRFNRIYLANNTCVLVDELLNEGFGLTFKAINQANDLSEDDLEMIKTSVEKKIMPMKENLEQEFKSILGAEAIHK